MVKPEGPVCTIMYRGGRVVTPVEADLIDAAEHMSLIDQIKQVALCSDLAFQMRYFDSYVINYLGRSSHAVWYMKQLFRRTKSEQFRAYILKRAIEVFIAYGGGKIRAGVEEWFREIGPELSDEVRAEIQKHQDRVAQAVAPLLGGSGVSGGDQVED